MKLMDKIKDLFMDEVDDDEDIELEEEEREEYKEPPKEELPKVMRDVIERDNKKEEKREEKIKPEEFIRESRKVEVKEAPKEEVKPRKFTFPIDFDEEVKEAEKKEEMPVRKSKVYDIESDFKENYGNGNINVLNLEKETVRKTVELYPTKKEEDLKPKFKASPVISPVYGILDKNYTKEEVREKSEDNTMKRPSKKVDFETVRKKAFGNLADEIKDNMLCENCELYKEVQKINALKEGDLLYDMTVEDDKDLTIEKAYDNYEEFGVAYEPKPTKKVVIPEEEEDEETPKVSLEEIIKNNNDLKEDIPYTRMDEKIDETAEVVEAVPEVAPKPEVKEEIKEEVKEEIPSRTGKKKEAKVDDDFFELIDSMYKERTDD